MFYSIALFASRKALPTPLSDADAAAASRCPELVERPRRPARFRPSGVQPFLRLRQRVLPRRHRRSDRLGLVDRSIRAVAACRPIISDFRAVTSVVVPSYHEDPNILLQCLDTWRAQDPDEIIIVLDVEDIESYDRISAIGDPRVSPILFHHVGKRSALGVGIRRARGEIVVLVDSDTQWSSWPARGRANAVR